MNKIQSLRYKKDLSADEFAKELGICRSTLYNYETETRPIPSDKLIQIAKYFNTTTDYVLGLSEVFDVNDRAEQLERMVNDLVDFVQKYKEI